MQSEQQDDSKPSAPPAARLRTGRDPGGNALDDYNTDHLSTLPSAYQTSGRVELQSEQQTRLPPYEVPPCAAAGVHASTEPATSDYGQSYRSHVVQERENFLIFVKILFKILEEAREPEVRSKAQRIVMECRRLSQQGDPNFVPLMDALERRLRGFVGEVKWRKAHLFLSHYIEKKRNPRTNLSTMPLQASALVQH